jgi:hypothetical protein
MITLAEPGEDCELKALAYIGSVLADFSPAAKQRMLAYLNLRFDPPEVSDTSEPNPSPPADIGGQICKTI